MTMARKLFQPARITWAMWIDEEQDITDRQREMLQPRLRYPPRSPVSQASWTGL